MWNKEKLLKKLENTPQNVRYKEIETLFHNNDFEIIEQKGSHKAIVYKKNPKHYVTFALHNNDCKLIYKKFLRELYKFYLSDNKE
jgi:predicted RNA binding protein YcfA (HicA-like mRNA interferase family)